MAGKFVTIHGIDGVGKTTITDLVTEHLQAEGVDVLGWGAFAQESGVGELVSNRGDFQASIAKKALEGDAVSRFLEQGRSVIKDRWVLDVMASHAFKGALVGPNETTLSRVLKPNYAVVLVCDEEARNARMQQRENPTPEDLIPRTPGTRAYFFQEFLLANMANAAGRSLVVDTTSRDANDTANLIVEWIKGGDASV